MSFNTTISLVAAGALLYIQFKAPGKITATDTGVLTNVFLAFILVELTFFHQSMRKFFQLYAAKNEKIPEVTIKRELNA